jgi:hypothetical protein
MNLSTTLERKAYVTLSGSEGSCAISRNSALRH